MDSSKSGLGILLLLPKAHVCWQPSAFRVVQKGTLKTNPLEILAQI
jgi:hypothetical protein